MGRSCMSLSRRSSASAPPAASNSPPFPKQQLLVLALCRICEPIAFMGIFPYIYSMVQDFKITEDESTIAMYAGMVTSAFTFAEFSTGVLWGRLSDKVGRKPILLMGLVGTAISVLLFGFSPNLYVALFARALGGFLNGNIGVLQTTVAELVKCKEHQPRAYTIMPTVWCLGSIIGPAIGGALAKPCSTYPNVFKPGTIWETFPYLLPNLFSAGAVFIGVMIGILFLDETHAEKKKERDRGRELGKALVARLQWLWTSRKTSTPIDIKGEEQPLLSRLDDEPLPGYQTQESSPQLSSQKPSDSLDELDLSAATITVDDGEQVEAAKKNKTFTKPVILNIVAYGILAFHTMTYDQLLPIFLSTSPQHRPVSLPFKFSDGFGYDTATVGVIIGLQGIYAILSNLVIVPFVLSHVGSLRLFRLTSLSYFALYLVTPYLVLLPDHLRMYGIYAALVWKCTFSTIAYPSNAILLANSAPSLLALGSINGVAASTASLCRGFGPTISGLLYAAGLKMGYSGLPWWCSGLMTIVGAFVSLQITDPADRTDEKQEDIETAPDAS
ncbi:hypothetical protein PpBr36_01003 [Pyricularia pennisetigena]|uniref:hypothetical protein n=1 Tax=Pyricularia pennisetigena TaxID=1578925 RepID=UPI001152C059|nr:hypothetical protein PpBr36_01003 [Pyricularia pennisetigena]TLS28880.1 hypothetical protein PpBr36_01003 [Pyricularia pennisetigena]